MSLDRLREYAPVATLLDQDEHEDGSVAREAVGTGLGEKSSGIEQNDRAPDHKFLRIY
jgi:hypothetical protein